MILLISKDFNRFYGFQKISTNFKDSLKKKDYNTLSFSKSPCIFLWEREREKREGESGGGGGERDSKVLKEKIILRNLMFS